MSSSSSSRMVLAIGSQNEAKLRAVRLASLRLFAAHDVTITCAHVSSGVAAQPMTDEESIAGAINRAQAAQKACNADYGIGMEGGVQQIGTRWFECGWTAVVDRTGRIGLGSSGRFQLSNGIMTRIQRGEELGDIMDALSGEHDMRNKGGAMGVLTCDALNRDEAYSHGIVFAFAPFVSNPMYWK